MFQNKPHIGSRLLSLIAGLLVLSSAAAEDVSEELQQVREKISGMFESIDPENVNESPVDGWYTIHQGSIIAYVSADGESLIQNDLIDLDQQLNLSEVTRTSARRKLMVTVTDEQVITFSPSEVKYSVAVFTDVDCSYCRRLHSQIDEYLANGIEIRYLLYPRNGPASKSWGIAEEVWCSADRNNALTMAKLDRDFATSKCDASTVSNSYIIGQEVGLTGTPAIVFDDGTLVGGYLTPDQLAMRLEQNALSHK